jgi:hypothetical protein
MSTDAITLKKAQKIRIHYFLAQNTRTEYGWEAQDSQNRSRATQIHYYGK